MAKDIEHGSFRSKFLFYSAFHKNLRLTTTSRAMEWLEVLLRITTPENLRKYLVKISLEETRSISLLKKLEDEKLGIHELTFEFMITSKKWSHPSLQRHNLIRNWHGSYISTLELIKSGNRPINVNKDDLLSNHLYQHYWFYKLTKTDDSEFWFSAANIPNNELKEFLSVKPKGSYARMMCADLICGLSSFEEKCAIQYHISDKAFRIPFFENTYYDLHTSRGKSMTVENLSLILKNKHTKPCLHLSGQVVGVLWRLQTSIQFGDIADENMKLRSWHQTKLSESDYEQALELDKFYYHKIFGGN